MYEQEKNAPVFQSVNLNTRLKFGQVSRFLCVPTRSYLSENGSVTFMIVKKCFCNSFILNQTLFLFHSLSCPILFKNYINHRLCWISGLKSTKDGTYVNVSSFWGSKYTYIVFFIPGFLWGELHKVYNSFITQFPRLSI